MVGFTIYNWPWTNNLFVMYCPWLLLSLFSFLSGILPLCRPREVSLIFLPPTSSAFLLVSMSPVTPFNPFVGRHCQLYHIHFLRGPFFHLHPLTNSNILQNDIIPLATYAPLLPNILAVPLYYSSTMTSIWCLFFSKHQLCPYQP